MRLTIVFDEKFKEVPRTGSFSEADYTQIPRYLTVGFWRCTAILKYIRGQSYLETSYYAAIAFAFYL